MTQRDPFFTVKEEVQKTLTQAKLQYQRWCVAVEGGHRSDADLLGTELRTSLRNIDLDIEDLEETVSVVERNPKRFNIGLSEVKERRQFVDRTKAAVKLMRDDISQQGIASDTAQEEGIRQALLHGKGEARTLNKNKYMRLGSSDDARGTGETNGIVSSGARYTRLGGSDLDNDAFIQQEMMTNQQMVLRSQDETLDMMGSSVHVLKGMSRQIGSELDEQSVMLDEFAQEMEKADSKLDSNMKKIAKVLHMSNDRRQWLAIGLLALALFIVVLLFIIT